MDDVILWVEDEVKCLDSEGIYWAYERIMNSQVRFRYGPDGLPNVDEPLLRKHLAEASTVRDRDVETEYLLKNGITVIFSGEGCSRILVRRTAQ